MDIVLLGWSCESVTMIFGARVKSADTAEPAEWVAPAIQGVWGTVGGFMPNSYPRVLRVHAPGPSIDEWWSAYRDLFGLIASIGMQHTSSPNRAWFAVWEGHSFEINSQIAWKDPAPDRAARRDRKRQRALLRKENDRRNASVTAALHQIPCLDLRHRKYYLLAGPVSAADQIEHPVMADWHNPDLFWPDDRRWFAATDVDFRSIYIAGDDDFTTELARSVPTDCEHVALDLQLEAED